MLVGGSAEQKRLVIKQLTEELTQRQRLEIEQLSEQQAQAGRTASRSLELLQQRLAEAHQQVCSESCAVTECWGAAGGTRAAASGAAGSGAARSSHQAAIDH